MTTPTVLVDCPRCPYPLDPAALPHHPEHDLTAVELATITRLDDARAARDDARRLAELRAEHARARTRRARSGRRSRR